jgi:hypothetical protein
MAYITGNRTTLFFTSPRTADRLGDEIRLLVENFSGRPWNTETQTEFYRLLCEQEFYYGSATGDMAFKARDRVNRAPKALGFVDLKPVIKLTNAGKEYVYGPRPHDIFTKQLLKFQLHSPFHIDNEDKFAVKPYLEFMKLIKELNGVTKTELALFGIQLLTYSEYQQVKQKIEQFRLDTKSRNKNISYNAYINQVFEQVLREVYSEEIASNNVSTRESTDTTVSNFLTTKKGVHRDYADASIRYLRATTLFSFSPKTNKIYVAKDRADEVEFICQNIDPVPYAYTNEQDYKEYLFASDNVGLLTDDVTLLLSKISKIDEDQALRLQNADVNELKDAYEQLRNNKIETLVKTEVAELQTYEPYDDVVDVYEKITTKAIVEPPLFLEWNTWRAFTMLDDGEINGNFRIDDEGMPLYAAAGNMADIECHYRDFKVAVEVTMSSGQKQYEMEGEPVARHFGNLKRETDQDVYCIFIAPTLSPAAVAHFYGLHQISIAHYGGKAKIIPIQLNVFQQMLSNANRATNKPKSSDLRQFLEKASSFVGNVRDETEWLEKINAEATLAFTA